jgi:Ser/Thr protein kinase RdoA (MazF antagonist)
MRDFYDLTELGRARRLRDLALAALEQYDLPVTRVCLISNQMNGVFRVDTAEGRKVVLRVCLPGEMGHSLEQIGMEMAWLAALSRDTDLLVPHPVAARNGSLVTTAAVQGVPEPRHCVIFSWIRGRRLNERLTPDNITRYGEVAARLHAHAARWSPPEGLTTYRYDSVFPYRERVILFNDEHRHVLPGARRALFEQAIDCAMEVIARQQQREPQRIVHGDLHAWNAMVYRGQIGVFDFEDLLWSWPVQDIATSLYEYLGTPGFATHRAAFRRGYETISPWPEQQPGDIDLLMAARGINLANFVLHDPSPEWREATPRFFARMEARLRALLTGGEFNIENYPL